MTTRARILDRIGPTAAGRRFNPPITGARVRQLEAAGLLTSIRVGGMRFYDPAEVDGVVAERERRKVRREQKAAEVR